MHAVQSRSGQVDVLRDEWDSEALSLNEEVGVQMWVLAPQQLRVEWVPQLADLAAPVERVYYLKPDITGDCCR